MATKELNGVDKMGMESGSPSHSWSSNASFNWSKSHFWASFEMVAIDLRLVVVVVVVEIMIAGIRGWTYVQGKVRQWRWWGGGGGVGVVHIIDKHYNEKMNIYLKRKRWGEGFWSSYEWIMIWEKKGLRKRGFQKWDLWKTRPLITFSLKKKKLICECIRIDLHI